MNKNALIISLLLIGIIQIFIINYSPLDTIGVILAFISGMMGVFFTLFIYFLVDEAFSDT